MARARTEAAKACRVDLDALPHFLVRNDAGAPDHLAQRGAALFDSALAVARDAAEQVANAEEGVAVLRRYLSAWRSGHLGVGIAGRAFAGHLPQGEPQMTVLSATAVLWTLRSFDPRHRLCLERLLRDHRETAEAHPHWVIDVRGNGGGSDHTYAPILAWLMDNEWYGVGVEFLATAANIAAHRNVLTEMGLDDVHSRTLMGELVAALSAAAPGEWIRIEAEREGFVRHAPQTMALRRPERVAVLIDRDCASACEQFVLDLRQSRRVKVMGQPTRGVLDYSNLRPHRLPSGRHVLWYATSRSLRLPQFRVDGVGVTPDLYLPPPLDPAARAAEILAAQRFLESSP